MGAVSRNIGVITKQLEKVALQGPLGGGVWASMVPGGRGGRGGAVLRGRGAVLRAAACALAKRHPLPPLAPAHPCPTSAPPPPPPPLETASPQALAGNNLEKMAETMQQFEKNFENLDLQTHVGGSRGDAARFCVSSVRGSCVDSSAAHAGAPGGCGAPRAPREAAADEAWGKGRRRAAAPGLLGRLAAHPLAQLPTRSIFTAPLSLASPPAPPTSPAPRPPPAPPGGGRRDESEREREHAGGRGREPHAAGARAGGAAGHQLPPRAAARATVGAARRLQGCDCENRSVAPCPDPAGCLSDS